MGQVRQRNKPMKVIQSFATKQDNPIALTIGNFDGVHLGHQKILQQLKSVASEKGLASAVMTFSPHPSQFFCPKNDFLISTDQQKLVLLEKAGIDEVYLIPFNQDFAQLTPQLFIDKLINVLKVRYLLVGDDFRFGYQGKGDFSLLTKVADSGAFELARIETQCHANRRISSSRIRQLISEADFVNAASLLGYSYSFMGVVEHGRKLGRTLGFPTANLGIDDAILLPQGVFAVKVLLNNEIYFGVCNIGIKPTVDGEKRSVEVYLFDFNQAIYDETLIVTPLQKLRDEMKFTSLEALKRQIATDVAKAKALVNRYPQAAVLPSVK